MEFECQGEDKMRFRRIGNSLLKANRLFRFSRLAMINPQGVVPNFANNELWVTDCVLAERATVAAGGPSFLEDSDN